MRISQNAPVPVPRFHILQKNDSASKVRGLRAGADDYLTKPFDLDELIARILASKYPISVVSGVRTSWERLVINCLFVSSRYTRTFGGRNMFMTTAILWPSSADCGKSWKIVRNPLNIYRR